MRQPVQQMMVAKLDFHLQKNEIRCISFILFKNQLKCIKGLNLKPEPLKLLKEDTMISLKIRGRRELFQEKPNK